MTRSLPAVFLAAAAMLLTACDTGTHSFPVDDDRPPKVKDVLNPNTVSSEEMRQFTEEAVEDILNSQRFNYFLEKYEESHPGKRPVLKLAMTINETTDSGLNASEITDKLKEALFNSGKVDISMVEGREIIPAIPNSAEILYDDNFDPETVKKLAFQAASLILVPKVVSNSVTDNKTTVVTRTFTLRIADVETGLLQWIFTRQKAFYVVK